MLGAPDESPQLPIPFWDAERFRENIHRIETNSGDMFQSRDRIHAHLLEGAVDDAEFHFKLFAPAAGRETNIVGSIPVGVVGLLLKKQIEGTFTKNLWIIATMMIVVAVLLALTLPATAQIAPAETGTNMPPDFYPHSPCLKPAKVAKDDAALALGQI